MHSPNTHASKPNRRVIIILVYIQESYQYIAYLLFVVSVKINYVMTQHAHRIPTAFQHTSLLSPYYLPATKTSSQAFFKEFSDQTSDALLLKGKLIVIGDFNIAINKCESEDTKHLINITESTNLHQHVTSPTRFKIAELVIFV